MSRARLLLATLVITLAALPLAACGDDDEEPTSEGSTTTTTSTTTTSTTSSTTTTTSTVPGGLEQPAIWPSAGVRFATPEEAARDFMLTAFDLDPVLGEFQAGDSVSGEIQVFSPGEDGSGTDILRSTLLLRKLGPDESWFVIGAANENASIESPATGDSVPAGTLTVSGKARGFEANVVVTAFTPGEAQPALAEEITLGGAMAEPEPFTVDLDLSAAETGQVVVLLVRGGTGLEDDPGDFGAIPVVITG